MEEAGEWCSQRERDAMAIERTADNVARAFLLERELFENGWHREWDGEVIGLISAGAFVAFEGYEGMLPVRRLRGEWWELNELETMLIGAAGRREDPARRPGAGAGWRRWTRRAGGSTSRRSSSARRLVDRPRQLVLLAGRERREILEHMFGLLKPAR